MWPIPGRGGAFLPKVVVFHKFRGALMRKEFGGDFEKVFAKLSKSLHELFRVLFVPLFLDGSRHRMTN